MLDLVKLAAQMGTVSEHLQQEAIAAGARLESVLKIYAKASTNPAAWAARAATDPQHLWFHPAIPIEPLDRRASLSPTVAPHTVVATDGSQITPNHHEVAYCSLVNVGCVVLHYGTSRLPVLDSTPQVFYRAADLNRGRPPGVSVESILALRRTQAEWEELTRLALACAAEGESIVALADGALIHWGLDALPLDWHQQWLKPLLQCFDHLREASIPLAGYVSASRSSEMLNYLRLGLCPYDRCDCSQYCGDIRLSQAPCTPYSTTKETSRSLSDAVLWLSLLEPGQRSPIWRSQAKLLEPYGEHHIHFCYLHVGSEVARIEFPAWVVQDSALLDRMLAAILSQVQRGMGYPVALAEAHHLAVVRGGDRQRFFAFLERELERVGLKGHSVSWKEASKRQGIA
jgi:hypothetical protein